MNGSRLGRPAFAALVLALLLAGCGGGSGHGGSAFTFLSVERFSTNGTNAVGTVTSSLSDRSRTTQVCVTLSNNLKNPTVTAPTSLDNVQIESYTVKLTRLDGGPAPGPFTFNAGVVVPAGAVSMGAVSGNTVTFGIILVPAQAKNEAPLAGVGGPIAATADVVFRGRTGRGQRAETQGAVGVDFVSADEATSTTCAAPSTYGASLFLPVRPVYAWLSLVLLVGLVAPQLLAARRRLRS